VATNGSDGVSYANNNEQNPWQTIAKGILSLQAGDTLYIRGGNYQPTADIDIRSNNGAGNTGTANAPIVVTSYPGEQVVIDLSRVGTWVFIAGLHYWEFSNLEFTNAAVVIEVAGTALITNDTTIRNNRMIMNRGGDNLAAIKVGNAFRTVVDGNEVIGPGNGSNIHGNTSCIFTTRNDSIKVLNNRITNCPNGFHFKHENTNTPGADIEVAYNYFTNSGRSGLHYNGNYGYIHDNIFGPGAWFQLPLDNGLPGGNNNRIEHNTFVGSRINLTQAGGGAQNNIFRDNIFTEVLIISQYNPITHNSSLDYNMHPSGSNAINEFGTTYSVQSWQSHYGDSFNSVAGSPSFVGGNTPTTVDGFRLQSSSLGRGAASDGSDMGARIDLFGSSGTLLVRPNPPVALTVN
jgi:hypothetical protein